MNGHAYNKAYATVLGRSSVDPYLVRGLMKKGSMMRDARSCGPGKTILEQQVHSVGDKSEQSLEASQSGSIERQLSLTDYGGRLEMQIAWRGRLLLQITDAGWKCKSKWQLRT